MYNWHVIKKFLLLLCTLIATACSVQRPRGEELEKLSSYPGNTISVMTEVKPEIAPSSETNMPTSIYLESLDTGYLLFALDDDLWRLDFPKRENERLTENRLLNWQMNQGDEWRLNAMSRPPQLSPDGKWITISPDGESIVLVNVEHRTQTVLPGPGAPLVAWAPDTGYLAYAPAYSQLYVYDLLKQEVTSVLQQEVTDIVHVVWSPDGQHLAIGCCFVETDDGQNLGEIKKIHVASGQVETIGQLWSSVGGGSPPICWINDQEVKQKTPETVYSPHCSYSPPLPEAVSHEGNLRAFLQPASANDTYWTGPSLLTVEEISTSALVWQKEIGENAKIVVWSADDNYLFLDDNQSDSPIWRIAFGASSVPEVIVNDGYLIDIIDSER